MKKYIIHESKHIHKNGTNMSQMAHISGIYRPMRMIPIKSCESLDLKWIRFEWYSFGSKNTFEDEYGGHLRTKLSNKMADETRLGDRQVRLLRRFIRDLSKLRILGEIQHKTITSHINYMLSV